MIRHCIYGTLGIAICFAAYRQQADEEQALRNYVEKSRDPETRQQAQIDYFGHDVESPSDLFERIREEARRKRETLVPRSPAVDDPFVTALNARHIELIREQYRDELRERRKARN